VFTVSKRMEIAGSHMLSLPYHSPCQRLHGHNWIVTVWCRCEELNDEGMVVDFGRVKELVHEKLDHRHVNDIMECNPTAENIARWICNQVPHCFKVEVQESEGNYAIYEQ